MRSKIIDIFGINVFAFFFFERGGAELEGMMLFADGSRGHCIRGIMAATGSSYFHYNYDLLLIEKDNKNNASTKYQPNSRFSFLDVILGHCWDDGPY